MRSLYLIHFNHDYNEWMETVDSARAVLARLRQALVIPTDPENNGVADDLDPAFGLCAEIAYDAGDWRGLAIYRTTIGWDVMMGLVPLTPNEVQAYARIEPAVAQPVAPDTTAEDTQGYHVRWDIDVDAVDPESAAQQACDLMRAPTSTANLFDVTDTSGEITRIDLDAPRKARAVG